MNIQWINPAALAGLIAALGPVVVHLLRRQRAVRVRFPTVRFLTPSRAAPSRVRAPSDPLLLILRVAIVAAAALAAAQPVVITGWRRAALERTVHRAVVVDTSESVASGESRVAEALNAERLRSPGAREFRTANPRDGVKQAAAALKAMGGGRAEIVVISDFQKGALGSSDVTALPEGVGLRFTAIDSGTAGHSFTGWRRFAAGDPGLEQRITLDGPHTRVSLMTGRQSRMPAILARPEDGEDIERMLRAVAAAGAPALPSDRGLTLIFPGSAVPAVDAPRAPWMIEALMRARTDERLRAAAAAHATDEDPHLAAVWRPVVSTISGHPLVAVAAAQKDLAVSVSAAPATLLAASALRSMLHAVAPAEPWAEHEVERIGAAQLSAWTREPAPQPAERWTGMPSDGRWFWALALLMLAGETVLRKTRPDTREEHRRAA